MMIRRQKIHLSQSRSSGSASAAFSVRSRAFSVRFVYFQFGRLIIGRRESMNSFALAAKGLEIQQRALSWGQRGGAGLKLHSNGGRFGWLLAGCQSDIGCHVSSPAQAC